MKSIKNKWALVSGASSGIGKDIAEVLAERGCNVIVVARRKEKLNELAKNIKSTFGVNAKIIVADLSTKDAPLEVYNKVKKMKIDIDILVNNAGYGIHGDFIDGEWEAHRNMLELLIISLTYITRLFVGDMVKRGTGHIMQVASTGAFQPTPGLSDYAAAKSYVLNFGEALNYELRKTGVKVSILCPGATITEFGDVANVEDTSFYKLTQMTSRKVAEIGVKKMLRGKTIIVTGGFNRFNSWLVQRMPRKWVTAVVAKLMK